MTTIRFAPHHSSGWCGRDDDDGLAVEARELIKHHNPAALAVRKLILKGINALSGLLRLNNGLCTRSSTHAPTHRDDVVRRFTYRVQSCTTTPHPPCTHRKFAPTTAAAAATTSVYYIIIIIIIIIIWTLIIT